MLPLTRRQMLLTAAGGLVGLRVSPLPAVGSGRIKARARSVIFLHQWGGPSHHDTFDMKPTAPAEVRGELKPIASSLTGVQVSELLPRMARIMDRVTLLRSL